MLSKKNLRTAFSTDFPYSVTAMTASALPENHPLQSPYLQEMASKISCKPVLITIKHM